MFGKSSFISKTAKMVSVRAVSILLTLFLLLSFLLAVFPGTALSVNQPWYNYAANADRSGSVKLFGANQNEGLTVIPMQEDEGEVEEENIVALAEHILGEGGDVEIVEVRFQGAWNSAGYFQGKQEIIGFEQGIILSTGFVENVIGPNTEDDISGVNDLPGDSDLDALIPGYSTYDATYLEIDFIPKAGILSFSYVFASDEYPEYVGSAYNDVFGFFVNGVNKALLPVSGEAVAINNVNHVRNSQYYRDNHLYHPITEEELTPRINTEMDGLTTVLNFVAEVNQGEVNTIKLAIADAGDMIYDSNVFIKTGSLQAINPVPVEGIDLNKGSTTIEVGNEELLFAWITPAGATNQSVTWTSENEDVATISANGTVKGEAPGSTTITVTTADGSFTATCQVTVTDEPVAVEGISLTPEALNMVPSATEILTPELEPAGASNQNLVWSSSDTTVATVGNGVVNALKAGEAIIEVETVDGGYKAQSTVTVEHAVDEHIIIVCANPVEGGVVGGGGVYAHGESVTVTATPNSGYEFVSWTDGECDLETMVTILGGDVAHELEDDETEYTHTFEAETVPPGQYLYEWDFGDGNTYSESKFAGFNSEAQNTFSDGIYLVQVEVYDPAGNVFLASDSVMLTVIEDFREYDLDECDVWTAAQSGGYGTTVDLWDISTLPPGTTFDIEFDAYSIPDKFIVQYGGAVVLDTGWRGSDWYEDNPLYPGGIAGPGRGTEEEFFTKTTHDSFMVTVYGPESGTAWRYSVRANCPAQNSASLSGIGQADVDGATSVAVTNGYCRICPGDDATPLVQTLNTGAIVLNQGNNTPVSTDAEYTFTATGDRSLVANFRKIDTQPGSPRYIYYRNADGDLVRADYVRAVQDVFDGDTVLRDAISAALRTALVNFRAVYVEDDNGRVIDYAAAIDDQKTYPEAAMDYNTYGVEAPVPDKELIINPATGAPEERDL